MTILASCHALAPALLCRHADLLLYLAPSGALALVIRLAARRHPAFFVFTVAGTLCHELAHACVGYLTGARPVSLTVIPRRVGARWELGAVVLTRVRWYNAAPAALAPFLLILLPLLVAHWRTRAIWSYQAFDILIALALAPQLLSCWPSRVDWKIALRSWPYPIIIALAIWLFQFVKT